MAVTADQIREILRYVIDPELGINIVDLGLVYEIEIYDGGKVQIVMTMTTPGCPMTGYLSNASRQAAEQLEGVEAAMVNVVWSPPWDPTMMTEQARRALGGGQ